MRARATAALVMVAGGLAPLVGAPVAQAVVEIHPLMHAMGVHSSLPPTEALCKSLGFSCYTPLQIETAYNTQPLYHQGITGAGETIAIVDSFGLPTIATSLAVFDKTFGLPAPPSLQVIQPAGKVPPFNDATTTMVGWAGETVLDVEYAHTMAPGASILLVETPVAETEGVTGFPQIITAENYVVSHHLASVVSQSFGAGETTFPNVASITNLRSAYLNAYQHGVTMLVASGDNGSTTAIDTTGTDFSTTPETGWPASDPLVTAVGGTLLSLNTYGQRTAPDTVWNTHVPAYPLAGGGGVSAVFSRPTYQQGVASAVGVHRGVPDVAMSGSCAGGVDTYMVLPGEAGVWTVVCGTSEASPLFSGIVALADQVAHHPLGLLDPALYLMSAQRAPGLVDVTSGTNAVNVTHTGSVVAVPGYTARPGYDLASGVGTVNAALFVPELVQAVARAGNSTGYGLLLPPGAKP